jgi:broad specificity phosphatase PhoE
MPLPESLLLLRHGETEWNRVGRLQGRDDSPLTPRGLAQAGELALVLRPLRPRRILCSPLGRAQATAEALPRYPDEEVHVRDGLAEMSFGACAGLTLDQVRERFPGLLEERERDRWNHRWPGGENYADVLPRVLAAIAGDAPLHTFPPTVIVAHQSVNRALLHGLGGIAPAHAMASEQSAEDIIRIDADGTVWHARVSEYGEVGFRWHPGPPGNAAGSGEALRTQRTV